MVHAANHRAHGRLGEAKSMRRAGPSSWFDHISWTGTAPEPSASSISVKMRASLVPASLTGMSPTSPPAAEYQPSLELSPVLMASSTSGSVLASLSSW